jgi:hypothetical protein
MNGPWKGTAEPTPLCMTGPDRAGLGPRCPVAAADNWVSAIRWARIFPEAGADGLVEGQIRGNVPDAADYGRQ